MSGDGIDVRMDGDFEANAFPHFLIYGQTGSGKTCLANTLPGPRVVISTENNSLLPLKKSYDAIPRAYRPDGEDSRVPKAKISVESWAQAEKAVRWIEQNREKYGIRSVIFDTVTGLSELCRYVELGGRPGMTTSDKLDRQGYGSILLKLEGLRYRMQKLPLFVCWVAGMRNGSEERGTKGQLLVDLVGQAADRYPQGVEFLLPVERVVGAGGRSKINVHTVPSGIWRAKAYSQGGSGGNCLPIEVPDLTVLLAKCGWLPDEEALEVLAATKAAPAAGAAPAAAKAVGSSAARPAAQPAGGSAAPKAGTARKGGVGFTLD